jgi:hypothetical protein
MYDLASMSLGCANPIIAENEINGVSLITPWSATNAQYRRDVMIYVQTLAARGAHPVLLVPSEPFMGDVAGDWWREVSKYADIVRESYFGAPRVGKMGPVAGSRFLRDLFRRRVASFTAAGIPTRKLGIMLGFHTTPGLGGRDRAPLGEWLEVTKLQTLAAKQVAREVGLRSIWSWGWGVFSVAEDDPDKPKALCDLRVDAESETLQRAARGREEVQHVAQGGPAHLPARARAARSRTSGSTTPTSGP